MTERPPIVLAYVVFLFWLAVAFGMFAWTGSAGLFLAWVAVAVIAGVGACYEVTA